MTRPKVCVLRAPGTNCDVETAYAFDVAGAQADRLHLFRLLENPSLLRDYQVLCVPGGFSYGDDVGAGVIFSSQLRGHLGEIIGEFLQRQTLVLGICNGFQVLLKAGILPGGADEWPPTDATRRTATLTWNRNGKYTAMWVKLKVLSSRNVFLRDIDEIELPIAHAEGRLAVTDPAIIDGWVENEQVALCYVDPSSPQADAAGPAEWLNASLEYPANPNGSVRNIAGLGDPSGRILGLMPHPERFLQATHHPRWTRLGLRGAGAGLQIFRNAVEFFA